MRAHLLVGQLTPGVGVPHGILQEALDVLWLLNLRQVHLKGLLCHLGSYVEGDGGECIEGRVHLPTRNLFCGDGVRHSYTSHDEEIVRDVLGLDLDGTKPKTWEDEDVVALPWGVDLALVLHGGEGGTGGKDALPVAPCEGVFGCDLSLAGGVGQWEDEGLLLVLAHLLDMLLEEGWAGSGEAEKGVGLDVLQYGQEVFLVGCAV
mmetsp:Transcript_1015/g.3069  ORF Transcript_1015/g.3069 Transcript_1015/m.3069 type:complete len:205 (+) Transcript_1015:391-1005(+)